MTISVDFMQFASVALIGAMIGGPVVYVLCLIEMITHVYSESPPTRAKARAIVVGTLLGLVLGVGTVYVGRAWVETWPAPEWAGAIE